MEKKEEEGRENLKTSMIVGQRKLFSLALPCPPQCWMKSSWVDDREVPIPSFQVWSGGVGRGKSWVQKKVRSD